MKLCRAFLPQRVEFLLVSRLQPIGVRLRSGCRDCRGCRRFGVRFHSSGRRFNSSGRYCIRTGRNGRGRWNPKVRRQGAWVNVHTVRAGRVGGRAWSEYRLPARFQVNRLRLAQRSRNHQLLARGLLAAARHAADEGMLERTIHLFGAAEMILPHFRVEWDNFFADYAPSLVATRAAVDPDAFAAEWAVGQAMTLDEAIAYALDDSSDA